MIRSKKLHNDMICNVAVDEYPPQLIYPFALSCCMIGACWLDHAPNTPNWMDTRKIGFIFSFYRTVLRAR